MHSNLGDSTAERNYRPFRLLSVRDFEYFGWDWRVLRHSGRAIFVSLPIRPVRDCLRHWCFNQSISNKIHFPRQPFTGSRITSTRDADALFYVWHGHGPQESGIGASLFLVVRVLLRPSHNPLMHHHPQVVIIFVWMADAARCIRQWGL